MLTRIVTRMVVDALIRWTLIDVGWLRMDGDGCRNELWDETEIQHLRV